MLHDHDGIDALQGLLVWASRLMAVHDSKMTGRISNTVYESSCKQATCQHLAREYTNTSRHGTLQGEAHVTLTTQGKRHRHSVLFWAYLA